MDNTQLFYGLAKQICEIHSEKNEILKIQQMFEPWAMQFYENYEIPRSNNEDKEIIVPPGELITALKCGDVNKWNAWADQLSIDSDNYKIDLRGIYLNHLKLNGINLNNTLLTDAEIINSDLSWENEKTYRYSGFINSDLQNAIMTKSNFFAAKFTNANLSNADFCGSKIDSADLSYTILDKLKINVDTVFDTSGIHLYGLSGINAKNNVILFYELIRQICTLYSSDPEIIKFQKSLIPYANKFVDEYKGIFTIRKIDEDLYKSKYVIKYIREEH